MSRPSAIEPALPNRGYTPREVATRLRVSPDRVRGWIQRGELRALNLAGRRCGRARYVVTPEALADFERSHEVATPAKPTPRRQRLAAAVDYYPD